MKKSTIWILGIVMGLSFLSLLYLQVSYIEEMVKMRREQFNESVQRSLAQACRNIELLETKRYLEADVVATERAARLSGADASGADGEVVQIHQYGTTSQGMNYSSTFELKTFTRVVLQRFPRRSSRPERTPFPMSLRT